jgi:peptidoglycan/xylan/chitin deacetylase (PgdA/CDA1 family)
MSHNLTIIMYHFVRDLQNSRFPQIKGLDTELFKGQLAFLNCHYQFVTMERVIESLAGGAVLPEKAVLLTFDDAYNDHYTNVFPILDELGIQGSFFPPVKAITCNQVLDVNKIHFVLAAVSDTSVLVETVYRSLDQYRSEFGLADNHYYFEKLAKPSRMDTAEVIFIKRLLQSELDVQVRMKIVDDLFKNFVGIPEEAFSRELYMNVDQIKTMHRHGMFVGSHGYDHVWLATLSKQAKEIEIDQSLEFLEHIGVNLDQWAMCYPYGNYDSELEGILGSRNCKIGLTTEVAIANLDPKLRFRLPRLDTNDLPKQVDDCPNHFYARG